MYKSSLRHIHDPVLSSLKMKGIRLLFSHSLGFQKYKEKHKIWESVTLSSGKKAERYFHCYSITDMIFKHFDCN
jgi:hypothetical protein